MARTAEVRTTEVTDPVLAERILNSFPSHNYRTQLARELVSLELYVKAARFDECSQIGYIAYCADNHPNKRVIRCGLASCKDCVERWCLKAIAKYKPAIDCLLDHNHTFASSGAVLERFTYLDIRIPSSVPWTPDMVRTQLGRISPALNSLLKGTLDPKHVTRWILSAGFTPERELVVHVLSMDNTPATREELKAAWPDAEVSVSLCPLRLAHNFLKHLFTPVFPKTPAALAAMEFSLTHVQRLRTNNLFPLMKESELFVEDFNPTTDNYEDEDPEQPERFHQCGDLCRVCKRPIVEVTERYNIFTQLSGLATLKRYHLRS
jgi:hypothetical protein